MTVDEMDFLSLIGEDKVNPEDKKEFKEIEEYRNNAKNNKIESVKKENKNKSKKDKEDILGNIDKKREENKLISSVIESEIMQSDYNINDKSYEKVVQLQKEILRNIVFIDKQFNRLDEIETSKDLLKFSYAKLEYLKERTNCLELLYKIVNDNPDIIDDSDIKDLIDFVSKSST